METNVSFPVFPENPNATFSDGSKITETRRSPEGNISEERSEGDKVFGGMQLFLSISDPTIIVLSFIAVISHIPLLAVLRRCRKMQKSLRLLTMNFAVCSLLYFFSIMSLKTIALSWSTADTQTFYEVRLTSSSTSFATTIISIGGLALERYIRVMYPLVSTRILKSHVVIGYIASAWLFGLGIPISVVLYEFTYNCGLVWSECALKRAWSINRVLFFFTFTSFLILICFSCFKISRTIGALRVHTFKPQDISERCDEERNGIQGPSEPPATKRANSSKGFKTTGYTVKIMLIYIICNTPLIINSIIFRIFPNLQTILVRAIFVNLSFCSTLASFFISLHFYIWKFRECKLVFLQLFCTWNKRYERETQDLKMDIYDIPSAFRERNRNETVSIN